jgi:PHD/YefM family antitoxin component YafN of YafNO toxin-antitoxin module
LTGSLLQGSKECGMGINSEALNSMVPISQFNKGLASKIFDRLKVERQLVVLKNNTPTAVIVSPEEYARLADAEENLYLLQISEDRIAKDSNLQSAISSSEFWDKFGIKEDDITNAYEPEIE